MKKTIFAVIFLISSIYIWSDSKIDIKYEVSKSLPKFKMDLNPFYFYNIMYEAIYNKFEIYNQYNDDSFLNAVIELFNTINHYGTAKLICPNYQDGNNLVFEIKTDQPGDKLVFLITANYDPVTKTVFKNEKMKPNSWVYGCFVIKDKLVYFRYVTGGKEKPPESEKTALAAYYLFDDKTENDSFIENILLPGINELPVDKKLMSYIILTQYYLMIKNYQLAENTIINAEEPLEFIKKQYSLTNYVMIYNIAIQEIKACKMQIK